MSTLFRSALLALALTSASVAAVPVANAASVRDPHFSDNRDPYGGYSPNSPQGNRAFWDYQSQYGN